MKINPRDGELDRPKAECLGCLARGSFFACTACEFTETMIADANKEYNRLINESLIQLDETRSECDE